MFKMSRGRTKSQSIQYWFSGLSLRIETLHSAFSHSLHFLCLSSLSMSFCLSVSLSLSLSIYIYIFFSISLYLYMYRSIYLFLGLLSLPLKILSLSPSFHFTPPLSLNHNLNLSQSSSISIIFIGFWQSFPKISIHLFITQSAYLFTTLCISILLYIEYTFCLSQSVINLCFGSQALVS